MSRKTTGKISKEITDHIREIKSQVDEAENQLVELVKMKIKFSVPKAITETFDPMISSQQEIIIKGIEELIQYPRIALTPKPTPQPTPPASSPSEPPVPSHLDSQ